MFDSQKRSKKAINEVSLEALDLLRLTVQEIKNSNTTKFKKIDPKDLDMNDSDIASSLYKKINRNQFSGSSEIEEREG
jgi:hypothetical protein